MNGVRLKLDQKLPDGHHPHGGSEGRLGVAGVWWKTQKCT
jgi:hypothetical protein